MNNVDLHCAQESANFRDERPITVSIVSHGQKPLVEALLTDLEKCHAIFKIVLTTNIPEPKITIPSSLDERVEVIHNLTPKGFGANHNSAFALCTTPYFAVLNPDIRIPQDPFPELLTIANERKSAVCTPAILSPNGSIEDNARVFPTPWGIVRKLSGIDDGRIPYQLEAPPFSPDWIGGMFMLFDSTAFRAINGFDEKFFLYYEDVDICARLRNLGHKIIACPSCRVIHDGQRASRRSALYLRWHLSSMFRFWHKHLGKLPYPPSSQ